MDSTGNLIGFIPGNSGVVIGCRVNEFTHMSCSRMLSCSLMDIYQFPGQEHYPLPT